MGVSLWELVCGKGLCRFFEKKLRKKLSCRKVFGSFQKKYARRLLSIVGRFFVKLCHRGMKLWNLILLRPSLAVGTADHCRPPHPSPDGDTFSYWRRQPWTSFRQQIFNAFIGESLIYRKAPLCKGSWRRRRLRDCFVKVLLFTIPPSRQAVPPPFTQGRLGWLYADNRFLMKLLTEFRLLWAFSYERRGTAIAVDE